MLANRKLKKLKKKNDEHRKSIREDQAEMDHLDRETAALDEIFKALGDKKISDEIYVRIKQAIEKKKSPKKRMS